MRRNEITRFGQGDFNDVVSFIDDFVGVSFSATADTLPWLATLGGTNDAVAIADDGPGGLLKVTSGTADNEESSLQLNGESFKLAVGKRVRFSLKNVKIDDASDLGAFIGLAITDTSIFGDDSANAVTDYVGFLWDGTDLFAVSGKDANASWTAAGQKTDTGLAFTDDTYISEMVFEFDGAGVIKFYVNGAHVATVSDKAATKTLYPDNEALTPTIAIQTLNNGGSSNLYVDYINVGMDR